jgi:segregation and condensation protein A
MEQVSEEDKLNSVLEKLPNVSAADEIKEEKGNSNKTNEKIYEVLFDKDDVTWQSIIYELVKSEEINPWDIDIGLLTKKYIDVVKKLKEFDFNISGKALLASAILLKIKSNRLVGEDLEEFDRIIAGEPEDDDFFEENILANPRTEEEIRQLIPRLPQPRKRKVSIYDLMGALEKALEVKERRVMKNMPSFDVVIPKKKPNVTLIMQNLFLRIKKFFLLGNEELTFNKLIPSETKEDKVMTFIPLLQLANRRKIDIHQEKPFGDISIYLRTQQDIAKELEEVQDGENQEEPEESKEGNKGKD